MQNSKGKSETFHLLNAGDLEELVQQLEEKLKSFKKEGFKKIIYELDSEYGNLDLFSSRPLTKKEEKEFQKEMMLNERVNLRLALIERQILVNHRIKNHGKALKVYKLANESKKASKSIQNNVLRLSTEIEYLKELNRQIEACLKNKNSKNETYKQLLKKKV